MAQYVFSGCPNLYSVTFAAGSKLESVSAYMFKGCDNLTNVTFENGSALTSVQAHGFEGMTKLQTVDFGNAKISNIDNYAFRYCDALQTINIPEGVTYIGRYAFYGDKSLTRLNLPASIEYIGSNAFIGAENCDVYFKAETLPLYLQENWDAGIRGYYVGVTDVTTNGDWTYAVLSSGKISLIKYTGAEKTLDLSTLNLGGEITQIGGYCFYNTAVETVVLPETLASIQQYAFACSDVKNILIPASVEFIGKYAFYNTPIQTVTFESTSKLKTIEQYAFSFTRSLKSVEIPKTIEFLGSYSFYQSGITAVTFDADSILTEIQKHAFASSALTSVSLPNSVTKISDGAFRDCLKLENVTFGNGKGLEVRSNAFYNTALTSLYIPENLEYIGEYAFIGLKNLTLYAVSETNPYYTAIDGLLYSKDGKKLIAVPAGRTGSLVLPKDLEVIGFGAFENTSLNDISFNENSNILTFGYRAFYNAQNLTSFTVPSSVVSIDYYAFAMCESLETVTFSEGSKLTGIYEGAFYGCKSLKNIVLPDGIVEISDFAFYGCSALTKLPISTESSLKGIYDYAFAYTGITDLTIPKTVADIGAYAFRGARLKYVTIPEANAQTLVIGIGAFADCNDMAEIALPFIGASFDDTKITWFGYIFGAGGL